MPVPSWSRPPRTKPASRTPQSLPRPIFAAVFGVRNKAAHMRRAERGGRDLLSGQKRKIGSGFRQAPVAAASESISPIQFTHRLFDAVTGMPTHVEVRPRHRAAARLKPFVVLPHQQRPMDLAPSHATRAQRAGAAPLVVPLEAIVDITCDLLQPAALGARLAGRAERLAIPKTHIDGVSSGVNSKCSLEPRRSVSICRVWRRASGGVWAQPSRSRASWPAWSILASSASRGAG